MDEVKRCIGESDSNNEKLKCKIQELDMQIAEKTAIIDHLEEELKEVRAKVFDLPYEPIEVAALLIGETKTIKTNPIQKALNKNISDEYETSRYSHDDLRQIAQHLLIHCGSEEAE